MIAVDTSALVAIALAEPERVQFLQSIERAGKALVSTVSVVGDAHGSAWSAWAACGDLDGRFAGFADA
jgi:uncharacterized protein with PIN domain